MLLQLWRRGLLIAAAVASLALVAGAYAPARDATFVWDDHVLAERDARFRHASIVDVMTGPFWPDTPLADARAPYYRPLVLLSLRSDIAAGGTAEVFHRTNIVLHLVASLLVAIVAVRLGARASGAILGALCWALAPRLTESVVWISGRTDVLAGALGLAALTVSPDVTSTRNRRGTLVEMAMSALSGLLLFGALASKEVAIAFAVAISIAIVRSRKSEVAPRRWPIRLAVNVGLPIAIYALLRRIALDGLSASPRPLGGARRLATVLEAVGRYAEMLVDPLHPKTMIGMLGEVDAARAALGAVVLTIIVLAFVRLRGRAPFGVVMGVTIAGLGFGLVLHILPFTLAGAVAADRLLYVPLAGLVLAAVVALEPAAPKLRFGIGTAALALSLLLFGATKARAADYQDEAHFWVVATERAHPHNTTPLSSLAGLVREAGETELACRLYEKANEILARSERAGRSAHRRARENLVSCWATAGRYDEALQMAETLARLYPDSGRIQMELGFARLHVLDFDGAATAFAAATRMDPALTSIVAPAAEELALARHEAPMFLEPTASDNARPRHARYLARIGHLPEAEVAHLAVVLDSRSSPADRFTSAGFLAAYGRLPVARRAFEAIGPLDALELAEARRTLALREERNRRIARLLPRIEAIAGS